MTNSVTVLTVNSDEKNNAKLLNAIAQKKGKKMFGKEKTDKNDVEVFVIFDSKSQSYDLPVYAKNKNVFARDVLNMFNDPQHTKNKYLVNAEDYSCFKIANYDQTTGKLEPINLEHAFNFHDLRAMVDKKPGIVPT